MITKEKCINPFRVAKSRQQAFRSGITIVPVVLVKGACYVGGLDSYSYIEAYSENPLLKAD